MSYSLYDLSLEACSDCGAVYDEQGSHFCRPVAGAVRHGWYGTYTNLRCRCQACRDAWAAYRRATRGSEK